MAEYPVSVQYPSNVTYPSVGTEPNQVSGLQGWWKASTGITKDGSDAVSVWSDQSGNGRHWIQPTGSKQPLWVSSGIGGLSSIQFDGASDYLICNDIISTMVSPSEFTFFAIIQPTGNSSTSVNGTYDNPQIFGDTGGYNGVGIHRNGSNAYAVVNWADSIGSTSTGITVGQAILVKARHQGGNVYVQKTADPEASAAAGNYTNLTMGVMMGTDYTQVNKFFGGLISEVAIYNVALSSSDIAGITSYLRTKYAV